MKKTCTIDAKRRVFGGVWRCVVAAVLMSGVGATAMAQPVLDPYGAAGTDDESQAAAADWPEGDTVRELLRADAQAARAASITPRQAADWLRQPAPDARRAAAPSGAAASALSVPVDRIDLLAIYGVGAALQADVSINGVVSRYRAGRATPLASSPGHGEAYVLQGIKVPCVSLQKAGQTHNACLISTEASHD